MLIGYNLIRAYVVFNLNVPTLDKAYLFTYLFITEEVNDH